MWDFDGDEWGFFMAATGVVIMCGLKYYFPLVSIPLLGKWIYRRLILLALPLVAIAPTIVVLRRWADASQVVGHVDYMILFTLGAGMWILAASWCIQAFGISPRDDAIERDNPAALIALAGFLIGVGLVYALSNIGSGPTIWTTLAPAFVATVFLGFTLLLLELLGAGVAEAITIERDVASGWRMAGVMLGCGIIFGRAVAGNWTSWDQTWVDLASRGWPAVALAVSAAIVHRYLRPTAARPSPRVIAFGLLPATLFVLSGIFVVAIETKGLHLSQW